MKLRPLRFRRFRFGFSVAHDGDEDSLSLAGFENIQVFHAVHVVPLPSRARITNTLVTATAPRSSRSIAALS